MDSHGDDIAHKDEQDPWILFSFFEVLLQLLLQPTTMYQSGITEDNEVLEEFKGIITLAVSAVHLVKAISLCSSIN